MSLKGNTSSAKLLTEQLRSDHIGTLELLQKCTNENVKLKKELKLLKAGNTQTICATDDTTALSYTLDSLELVETNAKQADEIKLLKSRVSQAELQLLKFNQLQTSLQQNTAQSVTNKLKKKEGEMEAAIIDLENQLRSADASLSDLRSILADLQKQKDNLVEEVKELKHINSDVYTINGNLTATIGILHAQISSLKGELDTSLRDKKSIEVAIEQKLNDSRKLLAVQLEQSAVLKKELSLQVEGAFRLQESNAQLVVDKNTADATCKSLRSNVAELSGVIQEQQKRIQELQNAGSEEHDESETFKFTAPTVEVEPTKAVVPEIPDGDATFRFQEFLRLKRENKELKIRLAEMETSKRVPATDNKYALVSPSTALASSSHPQLQSSMQGSITGPGSGSVSNSPRPTGIVGSTKNPPAGGNGLSLKTRNTLK